MRGVDDGDGERGQRRQGIFWLLTVPIPNDSCESVENGNLPRDVVWTKGQREKGENNGYEHYQFVVAFRTKKSIRRLQELFGRGIHAELSRSEAANEYVCKESTRAGEPWEHGAKPIRRNSVTDWDVVWEHAKAGNLDGIPANVRVVSYRTLRAIGADYATPKSIDREVFCYWGPTATGKSRRAWDEAGLDAYSKCPRSKFWSGYTGQKNAVIDEFRGGIDVSHMLRWCDRYPVHLEIKGASRPMDVERIWITSNIPPQQWYPELDSATLDALMRRMTVVEFPVINANSEYKLRTSTKCPKPSDNNGSSSASCL